jgi:hypothetical protein
LRDGQPVDRAPEKKRRVENFDGAKLRRCRIFRGEFAANTIDRGLRTIPKALPRRKLAVDQAYDDFGCAPHMRDRKKCKNGGYRPSRNKCLEPTGHEVDAQADIGESDHPAYDEDNQCADKNRKNKSPLAVHGLPLDILPHTAR